MEISQFVQYFFSFYNVFFFNKKIYILAFMFQFCVLVLCFNFYVCVFFSMFVICSKDSEDG